MAYIGNQVTSNAFVVDQFSGTGGQTVYSPLTFAPASTAAISVYINGVYQSPISAYSENDALFGTATSTRSYPRVK